MKKTLVIPFFLLCCFSVFCQKNQTEKSLVAYFPFSGNANDISTSKLNAKLLGAALTADITGNPNGAYYFNGSNAYIEVQSKPAINLTESFTISCWVAPESRGNYKSWVSKANKYSQWRFGFGDVSSKEWGFGQWNNDRADYYTNLDSIPLAKWSFLAASYNHTAKKVSLFLNGKLIESFDLAYNFLGSNLPLYIGYQKDDCTWFNGNIDEVKIFNRTLEVNEIDKLYKEFAGKIANPVFLRKSDTYTSQSGLSNYLNQYDPGNIAVRFAPQFMGTAKPENCAPAFTPDMSEVYWTFSRRERDSIFSEILVSKKVGTTWSEPQRASFSTGNYFEGTPRISADGKKLFIFRGKPVFQRGAINNSKIVCYTKVNNEWVNPQVIADGIYPSITNDGTIYYNSFDMQIIRISQKNGVYTKPDTIKQIKFSVGPNYFFFIAPDESYLVFTLRNSEVQDLYITFYDKSNNKWSIPAAIDAVNTSAVEITSGLSPDGKFFFFVRRTIDNLQDIFWVNSNFIDEMKQKAQWK